MRLFVISLICIFSFQLIAQESKVTKIIKEQALSQPIELGFEKVIAAFNIDYWLTLLASNRVHSAKHGQGKKVAIRNYKQDYKITAKPIEGVGSVVKLFDKNTLFPGKYQLTTNKGVKPAYVTIKQDTTIDYFQILKMTGTGEAVKFGRLHVTTLPETATVTIEKHHQKYHKGMKLPEGKYTITVSSKGYKTASKNITIKEKTNNEYRIVLNQKLKKKTSSNQKKVPVEKIVVTGTKLIEKPTPEKAKNAKVEEQKPANETVIEKIVVRPQPVEIIFDISWGRRLNKQVELTLVGEDGSKHKFKERVRNKKTVFATTLLPQTYKIELKVARGGHYSLADIKVIKNKKKTFKIKIDN